MNFSTLVELDKKNLWHPFTPMEAWCDPEHEPLCLVKGEGVYLESQHGTRYLDANSSIWANLHGHAHPTINSAIAKQLELVSHTSFLGFTNPPAIELSEQLLSLLPGSSLQKVFYSDNGSTAIETALRMSLQYWSQNGHPEKDVILSFDRAYHGDTLGAASLGGIPLFRGSASGLGYKSHLISNLEALESLPADRISQIAAVIIEPLIQGSAGMRLWPKGMLKQLEIWCRKHDIFLILDEVMTGFGRTGKMFAHQHEEVEPDFLCLAKGLTGGYLPLAATLTTQRVFDGFLGKVEEGRTFYYGHTYTGNALGCAAALANLQIFGEENTLEKLSSKIEHLSKRLEEIREHPHILEVRQCGLIAGIEITRSKQPLVPYEAAELMGAKVCLHARQYGILTRPVLNTLVIMPPLNITCEQIDLIVKALMQSVEDLCGN